MGTRAEEEGIYGRKQRGVVCKCGEEAAFDNIINGYPDGTFKPEKAVTRAELAAIYARMKKAFVKAE